MATAPAAAVAVAGTEPAPLEAAPLRPGHRAAGRCRWWLGLALGAGLALVLTGCATRAPETDAGAAGRAGEAARSLDHVPDAVPRIEPLPQGGPNRPYVVRGVRYVPMTADQPLRERGLASWYGDKHHGRPTSNGETFDMWAMTAAHKTMPLPSYARVRNPANGREIIVRINDRGPFVPGRIIDLSYAAARKLGVLNDVAPVEVERITHDVIRAGLPDLPADAPAHSEDPGPGYWLQLGAFRDRAGALQLQRLLQQEAPWLAARLRLHADATWVRVRAGPWPQEQDAQAAATRLADALPLQPLVLRLP